MYSVQLPYTLNTIQNDILLNKFKNFLNLFICLNYIDFNV